jgi:hypothetical protein
VTDRSSQRCCASWRDIGDRTLLAAVGVSVICGEVVGFWGAVVGALVGGAIGFLSAVYFKRPVRGR